MLYIFIDLDIIVIFSTGYANNLILNHLLRLEAIQIFLLLEILLKLIRILIERIFLLLLLLFLHL